MGAVPARSLKGAAQAGTNTLRVTVTNTMANQFLNTRNLDRWPDNVLGIYHKQCLSCRRAVYRAVYTGRLPSICRSPPLYSAFPAHAPHSVRPPPTSSDHCTPKSESLQTSPIHLPIISVLPTLPRTTHE